MLAYLFICIAPLIASVVIITKRRKNHAKDLDPPIEYSDYDYDDYPEEDQYSDYDSPQFPSIPEDYMWVDRIEYETLKARALLFDKFLVQ
ncbi:hypothetical protein GEMRC1_001298 [Eukaryota sp. GEM-RC1]